MSTQYYTDLVPVFPDPETWTFASVLRHWARERPDAVCLECPEEDYRVTYADALAGAEVVGSAFSAGGAQQGDRVVLMAANSSRFCRTWFGTALGGLVEVPINTNYEGEFLRHQLDIAQARFAVIDDAFAERWVAITVRRRRELPSGTVGGRIAWAKTPSRSARSHSAVAARASPTISGMI